MNETMIECRGSDPSGPAQQIARIAALLTEIEQLSCGANDTPLPVLAKTRASIERARSVVSDETGQYRIVDLRPGTYTVTFVLPGFKTEEIEPWDEHGESRRRLKVTFPDSVATHCPEQVFHIDSEGLISRLDYSAIVTGGIPTAHYTSEYRDFDGVRIATRRRAYRRRADATAITEGVAVAIDISDIRLS